MTLRQMILHTFYYSIYDYDSFYLNIKYAAMVHKTSWLHPHVDDQMFRYSLCISIITMYDTGRKTYVSLCKA